jgi:hypothetical protein
MFLSLSQDDLNLANGVWLDEEIVQLSGFRNRPYDWYYRCKRIREADGIGKPISSEKRKYNHFVPWDELWSAVKRNLEGKTRREAMSWLLRKTEILRQRPEDDDPIHNMDPFASFIAYNTWFTWAIESIVNYEKNIYYGYGQPGHNGGSVDPPAKIQDQDWAGALARVMQGTRDLVQIMPDLKEWVLDQYRYNYGDYRLVTLERNFG